MPISAPAMRRRSLLVPGASTEPEVDLGVVAEVLSGLRALADDLALPLLRRLDVAHLADLAVPSFDARLRSGKVGADHVRHQARGRLERGCRAAAANGLARVQPTAGRDLARVPGDRVDSGEDRRDDLR